MRTLKTGNVNWQQEFWVQCRCGDIDGLQMIFNAHRDKIQINKNDYDELDNTALMKAAENAQVAVVQFLLEHGAASSIDTQNRVRVRLLSQSFIHGFVN
jgi:uncharacterized protein CbrC (UPF0167 family)